MIRLLDGLLQLPYPRTNFGEKNFARIRCDAALPSFFKTLCNVREIIEGFASPTSCNSASLADTYGRYTLAYASASPRDSRYPLRGRTTKGDTIGYTGVQKSHARTRRLNISADPRSKALCIFGSTYTEKELLVLTKDLRASPAAISFLFCPSAILRGLDLFGHRT